MHDSSNYTNKKGKETNYNICIDWVRIENSEAS